MKAGKSSGRLVVWGKFEASSRNTIKTSRAGPARPKHPSGGRAPEAGLPESGALS